MWKAPRRLSQGYQSSGSALRAAPFSHSTWINKWGLATITLTAYFFEIQDLKSTHQKPILPLELGLKKEIPISNLANVAGMKARILLGLLAFAFCISAEELPTKIPLTAKLSLKDAQGGFAGFNGWVITVEPDGTWERRPFAFTHKFKEPDRRGKLTAAELKALAEKLKRSEIKSLPASLGKYQGANPHVVTLTFAGKACVFHLAPGAPLPKADPDGKLDAPAQFALIAQELMAIANQGKPIGQDR